MGTMGSTGTTRTMDDTVRDWFGSDTSHLNLHGTLKDVGVSDILSVLYSDKNIVIQNVDDYGAGKESFKDMFPTTFFGQTVVVVIETSQNVTWTYHSTRKIKVVLITPKKAMLTPKQRKQTLAIPIGQLADDDRRLTESGFEGFVPRHGHSTKLSARDRDPNFDFIVTAGGCDIQTLMTRGETLKGLSHDIWYNAFAITSSFSSIVEALEIASESEAVSKSFVTWSDSDVVFEDNADTATKCIAPLRVLQRHRKSTRRSASSTRFADSTKKLRRFKPASCPKISLERELHDTSVAELFDIARILSLRLKKAQETGDYTDTTELVHRYKLYSLTNGKNGDSVVSLKPLLTFMSTFTIQLTVIADSVITRMSELVRLKERELLLAHTVEYVDIKL